MPLGLLCTSEFHDSCFCTVYGRSVENFLESCHPGQGSTRTDKSGCTISSFSMICIYCLVPCHGAIKIFWAVWILYWFVPVCTGMYRYILEFDSINLYIPVHTSTHRYVPKCTCYQYIRVHTRIHHYIRVHTRTVYFYAFKKNCKQVSNQLSSATSLRTYPCTTEAHTSTLDIFWVVINVLVYIPCHCHISYIVQGGTYWYASVRTAIYQVYRIPAVLGHESG